MGNLKRFTTQYKGAEDRILLTGEDQEGQIVSLWLTQRLLLKTVPVLVDWLQKNHASDLKTTDNRDQAREMAKVFTRKPVEHQANTPATADDAAAPTADTPEETAGDSILVHSIDLNLNQKLLRLRFRQGEQELGSLALTGSQLRQWLAVLHLLWNNASWPVHIWPRWLREDTQLVANHSQGTLH